MRMRASKAMAWFAVALVLACQEGVSPAPSVERQVVEDQPSQLLVWNATRTFTVGGSVEFVAEPLRAAAASELETYDVSFWVRADRDETLQVNYVTDAGLEPQPFLRLVVPQGALWLLGDGSLVGGQDSVLISLSIDNVRLHVDFEPTGLQFRSETPAVLQVWYGGANPDFNGDGSVDGVDYAIEVEELGLWVRAGADAPWERLTAVQSLDWKWFRAELQHFSGYEVSY